MEKNKKLEAIIAKGMFRYVLVHGVIGWGVVTALLSSALMHFTSNQPFLTALSKAIILFPIGGIFWGLAVWFLLKKSYEKNITQQTNV